MRSMESKTAVPFQDLPLAGKSRAWDSTAAIARVRAATGSEDAPSSRYKRAFLWYDRENQGDFGAYKLPIADIVNGTLTAIPRAIFAAAAALKGARGGVDIPAADRRGVIRNLERYYSKLQMDSPFSTSTRAASNVIETKQVGGHVLEHKEITRDGVRLGVIEALIATWTEDTGGRYGIPDRFTQGAFADSIQEHRDRNMRQVRLKDQHGRTVGGFPIESVRETSQGLYGVGEINLETQQGAEMWALIRQGVLVDMSVGFTAQSDNIENGVRVITKAILWEGSVVDEPANRAAQIISAKSTPFQDLPIAPADTPWDSMAAFTRVNVEGDVGSVELKAAFIKEPSDEELDYQIADVIDGKLMVVPAALKEVSDRLLEEGDLDNAELIEHVERYYSKMGVKSPFPLEKRKFYGAADVREWKAQDIERALLSGVRFSKGAAKVLASRLTTVDGARYDSKVIARILHNLEEMKRDIQAPR